MRILAESFDLVIVGRGAAAFSAAIKSSELTSGQASIAMVGFGPLGGTCVNVGCVPSKYLIEAAKVVHTQQNPRYPGISSTTPKINFKKLMDSLREAVLEERETKYENVVKSYNNISVFEGMATFIDGNNISIRNGSGETAISGYNFIIATGSSTKVKNIPGLTETGYMTSDSVWDMNSLPQTIAIIGGGFIGLELGQALNRLGSQVKIIKEHVTIAPGIEPELGEALVEYLTEEGIEFLSERVVTGVSKRNGKKIVTVSGRCGAEDIEVDEILISTGRAANVNGLGLEKAGVKYSERGVSVGKDLKTSNPDIYAAGDVIDQRYKLETLAAREGTVAASNIFNNLEDGIEYSEIPWAIFTEPQLASVGFLESEYESRFGKAKSRVIDVALVPKARILREVHGKCKIVTDDETGKIVGVHVVSPYAAEFITEGVYAIKFGQTYNDLIGKSHIFPTVSEVIKMTAQSFTRDIEKMSCCME